MDSSFLASIFASQVSVLGKQLKPFCCGHAVLLDALASPFMRGGAITHEDLILAVWICSMSFEEGREKLRLDKDAIEKDGKEWGEACGIFDLKEQVSLFEAYLTEHTNAPERWQKGDGNKQKAPWALSISVNLQRELKWDESKAWNAPLQEALWAFACIAEANGDDSLISEEEREVLNRVKKAKEAKNGC